MLKLLHGAPEFNKTFATWLAALPEQGSIFQPEGMSEHELALLQGGYLVWPSIPACIAQPALHRYYCIQIERLRADEQCFLIHPATVDHYCLYLL